MAALEQRPCGEARRGSHPAHLYMQNACAYQCPGGDVLHDVPADAPRVPTFTDVQSLLDAVWRQGDHSGATCAALHTDADGRPVPCPNPPSVAKVMGQAYHLADNLRYAITLPDSPCPAWSLQEPHDAHEFASADGPARCPGWSEPDDGPGPDPAPPQSDAQRIRDLEYVIQRAREALGTDTPSCDHAARITTLEEALRSVLAHAEPHTERCRRTGAISANTVRRWHAVLRGEA